MSGIKFDPNNMLTWVITDPNQPPIPMAPVIPDDPIVTTQENYVQAYSPAYPDVRSINDSYQKTVNAAVMQKDELAGHYSPAPELPKNQTDYSKILFFMVGGFLIYKFIIKKG